MAFPWLFNALKSEKPQLHSLLGGLGGLGVLGANLQATDVQRAASSRLQSAPQRAIGGAVETSSAETRTSTRRTAIAAIVIGALLLLGLKIWTGPGMADIGRPPQVFAELLAVLLTVVPPINRTIGAWLSRLRKWRMPGWMPILLGIACMIYCGLSEWRQDRSFRTLWHDESAYEIQARMMARGRLWMPALPAADSFDSPYLFVRPVYASIYFPGTALLLAPAVLMHVPVSLVALVVTAGIGALLCAIANDLIDSAAALLAPLLWIASKEARRTSITPMSHLPLILMCLVATWAWLCWRRDPSHRIRWAILGGVAVGWAAITRPLDAVCLLLPLMIVTAWDLRSLTRKRALGLILVAGVAASPFLVLMGIHNWGVTGHWQQFPHEAYVKSQLPGLEFGFRKYDASAEPASISPQKRAMYDEFVKPLLRSHIPDNIWSEFWLMRLPRFLSQVVPVSMLIVLACVGIANINTAPRVVLITPLFLLPVALAFYAWIPDYYPIVVWPATCILILLGVQKIGGLIPPMSGALVSAATLLVLAIAIGSLPEFDPSFHDDSSGAHLRAINRVLDSLPNTPALVLFRYTPQVSYFDEPVYNTDVAWPDDARIVRAHDLGPLQNAKLFRYYASIQPQRTVYLFDRPTMTLTRLGKVSDLAKAPPRADH